MASELSESDLNQTNLLVLAYFDLGAVIHFIDMFFQYQSCGIDHDIWVDMCPKFFGQFGCVA